jgi:hypothetical protein
LGWGEAHGVNFGISIMSLSFTVVGAPPSGRWFVVCEGQSRRGRRSYKNPYLQLQL